MRKPRAALAAKGSPNALPARGPPNILALAQQQSAAPSATVASKPKKSGLSALKQQLGQINARAPVEPLTKDQARGSSAAPVEHAIPSPRAAKVAPSAALSADKQQQQQSHSALPRTPRPRPKSPVKRAASVLRNEPPPPSPSDAGSDLTYVSVYDDGEPVRPLAPAPELEQSAAPPAQKRVLEISPVIVPAQNARADSPWPEPQPAFEYDANGDQADEQEMQDDEELFEEPLKAPPPAQQVRRPYEPRLARQASVDYDVELDPRDLLASFLNADRAVKQSRPRRRDFDEDEPVAEEDDEPVAVADARAASSGSDSDLPDIDDDPVLKTTAKRKLRVKAASPSSSAEAAPGPTNALRSSRTMKAAPVSDDSDDRKPAPSPRWKNSKNLPAKARKNKSRKTDEGGPLDTDALLEMLPKRKRRVVVEFEVGSDDDATEYDEGISLGKRKPANGRKDPKAAPRARPTKSASRKKRAKVDEVEDEPDSALERARQKRLREYKELGNFVLGTEVTA